VAFGFSLSAWRRLENVPTLLTDISGERISNLSPRKPESEPEKFSVHVATTTQAIEDLRPLWESWTHSLDTDIEYYLRNLRSDPIVLCPYVIAVCEGGIAQAMLSAARVRSAA
jgi:hypothetical protein